MSTTLICLLSVVPISQLPPLTHQATWNAGLENPTRIAVTAGEVLVTDPIGNVIVRLDPSGDVLGSWPVPEGPVAVAAHPDGRIFVARRDDARVAVHDAAFAFLGFLNPVIGPFVRPTDLAVDPARGRVYVVDNGADRFFAFDAALNLALVVGTRGSRASEFKYPIAVAVDTVNDRVLVADQDNYRVQVFTPSGVFVRKFGYLNKYVGSTSEGWMPRSAGLVVDDTGRVLLTDALMGTVRVFNALGVEQGKVVTYGAGPGYVLIPTGIALDGAGRILVADAGEGVIEVYDPPSAPRTAARMEAPIGRNDSPFDRLRLLLFGAQTSLAALTIPGWDPPHMRDDLLCARCHGAATMPGGHEGLVEGQANLCFSCHSGGGQALGRLVRPTVNLGMSHAWGVDAVNAAYGSAGPAPGGSLALHLDGGAIKCATCHNQHNNDAAAPYLRGPADVMCKECHAGHADHAVGGSWQPTCTTCHAPHDPFHRNLSLVRTPITNLTLGEDKPVDFAARSGPNSFDDGDPAAFDGICQVCHTGTNYHRHDGGGPAHFDGQACTGCHPHENGFLPAGGDCTGCHAVAQGPRRAVVGEFPVGDAHAHYGAELDGDACLVCHSVTTHMNGIVELLDADDGSLYSFAQPGDLTGDPDLSDFCASCHDADGAARLTSPLDPFGNGNVPPDVATRFKGTLQWNELYSDFCFGTEGTLRGVNSHHDISDADQAFSGAKIECLNCHGSHQSSATQPLADPFDTRVVWTGTESAFCLACHGGGMGPQDPGWPAGVHGPILDVPALQAQGLMITEICSNGTGDCSAIPGIDVCAFQGGPWYIDYTWTNSAHGPNSKRGWESYSGAPEATLDCTVCHDPHGSYTDVNTAGNPYMIRDVVDGRPFVDDGHRPGSSWTGPPWDTFGAVGVAEVAIAPDGVTVDWGNGLCVICHADWLESQHFHGACTACQTCHGHGMLWGETDWGGGAASDTPCPPGLRCTPDSLPGQLPIHLLDPNREGSLPLGAMRETPVRNRRPAMDR